MVGIAKQAPPNLGHYSQRTASSEHSLHRNYRHRLSELPADRISPPTAGGKPVLGLAAPRLGPFFRFQSPPNARAVELDLPSLATAALIGWEWLQRETDMFATFDVSHYRPKEHPNMVRVVDEKTKQESWIPLFDDAGAPIYPELMAELDAIKRERIGGLMLRRDWGERGPWPTWPKPDMPDFTHLSRKVKDIIRSAGLRDELSFTSFRHGGFTEGGDAELTDRKMLAQGRHTTPKVLPQYVKRTTRQIISGTKKRRAARTKDGHLSEWAAARLSEWKTENAGSA